MNPQNSTKSDVFENDFWAKKLKRWANDPWSWCVDCVYTQDTVDENEPVKKFPAHFFYLEPFTKIWMVEPKVAVPKSRRMFMSWHCLILQLWDAMFLQGRTNGIVSKKEDDSNELIQRQIFVLENIREQDWPKELRPRWTSKYNHIEFPQLGSKLQGFPQGADQLRQYAFSRLHFDEMAFWDKARESYRAAKPTLDGGGKLTAISSAAPGFFEEVVHDKLSDLPAPAPKIYFPMQGVKVYRNPKNKFVIYELHYSANEAKRSEEYKAKLKEDLPYADYMREYEISWETHEGKPVFQDWNKKVHVNTVEEAPDLGMPIFLGNDQGLTPACVAFQLKGEDLVILKEYAVENMGAERFKEYLLVALARDFPEWNDIRRDLPMGMDPTAMNRRDVDERSYADEFRKSFRVFPGANSFEARRKCVEGWLTKFRKGRPCLRVNPSCRMVIEGFDGAYHYPEKMFEVEPDKIRPLKNAHANVMDALQYGLTFLQRELKRRRVKVPKPEYSFTGGDNAIRAAVNGTAFGRGR